jgi:mercuric reductase
MLAASLPLFIGPSAAKLLLRKRVSACSRAGMNVGAHIAHQLTAAGVELMLDRNIPVNDLPTEEGWPIIAKADGTEISPDLLLVATGRRPNTESLGLAELGIPLTPFIVVDAQLRTIRKNIFAIGDVNGLNLLDSAAASQAQVAIDAISGGTTSFSSRWVPRYLDTDPPVAAVGWMEREAAEAGLDVEVESEVVEMVTADDKTIAEPSKTMIKIIAERSTNQIRGCVAIGNQASEVINLAALAIQSGIGTREIERLMLIFGPDGCGQSLPLGGWQKTDQTCISSTS